MVRKILRKGRERAIHHTKRSFRYAKGSAAKFQKDFRKHAVTAISAALGFLVALSWREPLQGSVNYLISSFGLQGEAILFKFVSAFLITAVAVLGLTIATRWEVKED